MAEFWTEVDGGHSVLNLDDGRKLAYKRDGSNYSQCGCGESDMELYPGDTLCFDGSTWVDYENTNPDPLALLTLRVAALESAVFGASVASSAVGDEPIT